MLNALRTWFRCPALLAAPLGLLLAGGCGGAAGGEAAFVAGESLAPAQVESARFLLQATFGPTQADIALLSSLGQESWLDLQYAQPVSLQRPQLEQLQAGGAQLTQNQRLELWWKNAVQGQDQLRQRMAWSLSQIFVISDASSALVNDPLGMAEYYDILARGALGNYRELLEQVAKSPPMGRYLSMLKNQKADPAKGLRPDENFAREVMQLFSIGLVLLGPDGQPLLDQQGAVIATYDQDVVEGFAAAFTGWTYANATSWNFPQQNYLPMQNWEHYHDQDPKLLVAGQLLPGDQSGEADLDAALDALFLHPNVGPFLAQRLIQRFVTSNPSPAFVQRVAAVFDDDGNGERGDLWAVLRAILLDPEARTGQLSDPEHFGLLREPLLRQTALWRAFDAKPQNGSFQIWNPEAYSGQAPLRSPSVFNFYTPVYAPPGEIADSGLVAPEFQITTHSLITLTTNNFYKLVFEAYQGMPNPAPTAVLLDIGLQKKLAQTPGDLIDNLDLLLMGGSMSAAMGKTLHKHLSATPMGNGTQRALDAIYLVATSAQCAVQK